MGQRPVDRGALVRVAAVTACAPGLRVRSRARVAARSVKAEDAGGHDGDVLAAGRADGTRLRPPVRRVAVAAAGDLREGCFELAEHAAALSLEGVLINLGLRWSSCPRACSRVILRQCPRILTLLANISVILIRPRARLPQLPATASPARWGD
jgi:hypothetical protein